MRCDWIDPADLVLEAGTVMRRKDPPAMPVVGHSPSYPSSLLSPSPRPRALPVVTGTRTPAALLLLRRIRAVALARRCEPC